MEEPGHRLPTVVLEIPRGDATVARGHGERRRPRRGEPPGAAEQPEAGGFQPRRRDADDLSDLEPSRVLRLRSGKVLEVARVTESLSRILQKYRLTHTIEWEKLKCH